MGSELGPFALLPFHLRSSKVHCLAWHICCKAGHKPTQTWKWWSGFSDEDGQRPSVDGRVEGASIKNNMHGSVERKSERSMSHLILKLTQACSVWRHAQVELGSACRADAAGARGSPGRQLAASASFQRTAGRDALRDPF